ncbi:MAG: mannan endo,4-beta-mannosidase, partial [Pseudonocardiales bacterium]|nr:mannan endo,4-beta-mannosidase [Pseudonocardiales bacterium]
MHDLGVIGGTFSHAADINDSGEIVGSSTTATNNADQPHAFFWTASNGMVDLGTFGGNESEARAINEEGQVVGRANNSVGQLHAFLWTQGATLTDLGTLGGTFSAAVAINDNGQVTGSSTLPGDTDEHAFLWTSSGGMRDLGTLGGTRSVPVAINATGEVAGFSTQSDGSQRAFLWTPTLGMVNLGVLSGSTSFSKAVAVDDSGAVFGQSGTASGPQHVFRWTATTGTADLGTIGGTDMDAASGSGGGEFVGYGSPANNVGLHGFAWTESAGLLDLGTLGGTYTLALGVADGGYVVGRSDTGGGAAHAVLWRAPTPSGPPPGVVTRSGTSLLLDGQPYRPIGLNMYNANSNGWCAAEMNGSAVDDALTAIGSGKDAMRAWFFQQLATTNGVRDWTAFDRTLAAARTHGYKVIATLIDQWGNCGATNGQGYGYKEASWYQTGYTQADPSAIVSYRDWVQEIVSRYKDDPTILAWQLVNEPEVGRCTDVSEPQAASILSSFASDVSGLVKSIDHNHLVSLGTIGTGQCGTSYTDYKAVMSIPTLDLCEFHDYTPSQLIPGDSFNGLALRISQCNELGKPLLVGELGVNPADVGGTVARANLVDSKLCAQLTAGVAGALLWAWNEPDPYDITAGDPVLDVLSPWSDPAHTCSAPAAPTGVIAAGGDTNASVSWLPPSSNGGSVVRSYTVTSSPGGVPTTVAAGQTSATVTGLADGTAYTFTVAATNAAGSSLPSSPSAAVTPQSGNPPPASATATASPSTSTTVSTGTDPAQTGGTTSAITVPADTAGGVVSIVQAAASEPTPSGYVLGAVQIDVTAPAASTTNPLTLVFTLTPAASQTAETTDLYRAEGSGSPTLVPDCNGPAGQAVPDPCVSNRQLVTINGTSYIQLTVLASTASHWNIATPKPGSVKVSDAGYSPQTVAVQPGASVQWTFTGKKAH